MTEHVKKKDVFCMNEEAQGMEVFEEERCILHFVRRNEVCWKSHLIDTQILNWFNVLIKKKKSSCCGIAVASDGNKSNSKIKWTKVMMVVGSFSVRATED